MVENLDPNTSTFIYDRLAPKILEAVNLPTTFNRFQKIISQFADRNADVLQTNILGRQLLFSESLQDEIFTIFNIDKNEVLKLIDPRKTKGDKELTSPYFIERGGLAMTDQLVFLIPMSIVAGIYASKKKSEEAEFVYLTMFFKPYATRISRYFKFAVNEPQMLYTIEHLNERFDLKREGTIFNLLIKMAESSFKNYKKTLVDRPTDKDLYIIATAGCYSRVNAVIKNIFAVYSANSGKRLSFENPYTEVDDDDGDIKVIDNEIKTEATIKNSAAKRAINQLTRNPVNEKLLKVAVQRSFAGSGGAGKFSQVHMRIMSTAINEIIDKKIEVLPELIDCMLNSFIQQINPATKQRYRADEIKSPVFVTASLKIFRSPNSKDPNTLRVRELIQELLEACSDSYLKFETTARRNMKNCLFFYLILIIRGA